MTDACSCPLAGTTYLLSPYCWPEVAAWMTGNASLEGRRSEKPPGAPATPKSGSRVGMAISSPAAFSARPPELPW